MKNRFIHGELAFVDINDVSAFIFTIIQGSFGIVCKMKNCVEISLINEFTSHSESHEWLIKQLGYSEAQDDTE